MKPRPKRTNCIYHLLHTLKLHKPADQTQVSHMKGPWYPAAS